MQDAVVRSSTFRYAVFHYYTDDPKHHEVPIGVALWSAEEEWVRFRLLADTERIPSVPTADLLPYARAAEEQISEWVKDRRLPYAPSRVQPSRDEWWKAVRDLLQFRVRLSEPRPIDCTIPDIEFETLYDAVVSPKIQKAEKRQRIDGAISRAVGPDLAKHFIPRVRVRAFDGAEVEVLRAYSKPGRQVILEGANLAMADAERETDALASKMERITAANGIVTRFIVGVVCPPGGLNGATHLKKWLERKSGSRVYDLTREASEFAARAERAVAECEKELVLFKA